MLELRANISLDTHQQWVRFCLPYQIDIKTKSLSSLKSKGVLSFYLTFLINHKFRQGDEVLILHFHIIQIQLTKFTTQTQTTCILLLF